MILDLTVTSQSKHQKHKQEKKLDKLGFVKFRSVFTSNNAIKKVKRQPIEWKKIPTNHIYDKILVSRGYKELLQFYNKKTIHVKNQQNIEYKFLRKNIEMANMHMKKS